MGDIRAVDLPEVRAQMIELLAEHGKQLFLSFIKAGTQGVYPKGVPLDRAAELMAVLEAKRLSGDLFYIGADMAELSGIASTTLPPFTLMPEDLPAKSGLIFFEKPIGIVVTDERPIHITAASWDSWRPGPKMWPHGGIWVSWYSDRDLTLGSGSGYPTRLAYDNDTQIAFSPKPITALNSLTGMPVEKSDYPLAVLKSAWLLMQQPFVEVDEITPDRASRKRIRRMNQEPSAVRVIQLRRNPRPATPGQSDREYHHQWIVRGHWRQQWYPIREAHRPVWIAPHVKGPEGAPLIGGEKVHAWIK